MQYRGHRVEVLEPGTKLGMMRCCRVAVDGVPAIPFEVFEADFISFPTDRLRAEFLARQAMSLIETYGDGRVPRPVVVSPDRC